MVITVVSRVVDDVGEKNTDGDRPLITSNDCTTDPFGRTLGEVHGDEGGDETDTQTGEKTADNENRQLVATSLHGDTEAEDNDSNECTALTADPVSDESTGE